MKAIQNNFTVSGFICGNTEIRQFNSGKSLARFAMAVSRQETRGDETNRVSAFLHFEAWRNGDSKESFDQLVKNAMITVEGYFRPDEYVDRDGNKKQRVIMEANKFYPTPDKEETPKESKKQDKKG